MKPASIAPAYLTLYPGLAEIARNYGYALAIHGSVQRDLDLIAVPWVDDCADADTLVAALREHCYLCIGDPKKIDPRHGLATVKPHGRRAWMLYMDFGAQVDISVMPKGERMKPEIVEVDGDALKGKADTITALRAELAALRAVVEKAPHHWSRYGRCDAYYSNDARNCTCWKRDALGR